MASRLLAKKYLASIGRPYRSATERSCVETLIVEHRAMQNALSGPRPASWFGRLLWRLFGRWL